MKIKLLIGAKSESCNEVDINELMNAEDIKEIVKEKFSYNTKNFVIIYKWFILNDSKFLTFYKIQPNDLIWIGNIEDYLECDDIIVEVFLMGLSPDFLYLIVKNFDQITKLQTIIKTVIPDSVQIQIWDLQGNLLHDDKIISDISSYVKVIVSWSENEPVTYEESCKMHDHYLTDVYFPRFDWTYLINKYDFEMTDDVRIDMWKIGERLAKNVRNDSQLNPDWSNISKSFQDSRYLFCINFADRLFDLCEPHLSIKLKKYYVEKEDFENFLLVPLHIAIFDYINAKESFSEIDDVSLKNIILYAIKLYIDSIIDINENGEGLTKNFIGKFLLTSPCELYAEKKAGDYKERYTYIDVKYQNQFYPMKIPSEIDTVFLAKTAISCEIGIKSDQLYLIECGGHQKPSDTDNFELNKYLMDKSTFKAKSFFEIVSKMDSIDFLKPLGKGAFGEVYLCEDKISQQLFVLKKQLPNESDLYRDISIQSQISYSFNVLKYNGLFTDGHHVCMAMDYMSGGSLTSHLIKMGFLPESDIAKFSYQILLQIKELHRRSIIHRDIKCENVVLDQNNNAKLIDFGVSKCIDQLPVEKLLENLKQYTPGTLYYMAPEIINCQSYSNKIDIWSFGAMVIEMLTGERPYHKMGTMAASIRISSHKTIKFKPPYQISNDLKTFINACLKAIPEERPSAEELLKFSFLQNHGYIDKSSEATLTNSILSYC